eukprot:gene4415-4668_t
MSSNGRLVPESSKGLPKMAAADPLGCPNRLVFGRKSGYHPQKSFTFELVTPESDSRGPVQLTAISAANEVSALTIASVQLNLEASPAAPSMPVKAQNTEASPAKDMPKPSLPPSQTTSSGLRMAAAQSPSTASMMAAYAPRPVPPNMLSYEDLQLMLPGLLNSDGTINSDAIAPAAAKLSQLLAAKTGFSNQQVASTPQAASTSNRLRMSQAAAESTYDDFGQSTATDGGRLQQQRSVYPTRSRRAPGQQTRRLAPSQYLPGSASMPQPEPAAYISAINDVFGEAKPTSDSAWKPRQQDSLPILPSIHDAPTSSTAASPTSVSTDDVGALLQDAAAAAARQTSQAAQLPASVQPPLLGGMLPAQSDQRTAADDSPVETDPRLSPLEDSSLSWHQAAANLDDTALSASGWNVQDPVATSLLTNENTQLLQQQFSEAQQQASQLPDQLTLLQQQQQSLEQQVEQQPYQSGSGTSQQPPQTTSTEEMQVEAVAAPTAAYQPRPRYNPVRFDLRMPAMRLPSPMG